MIGHGMRLRNGGYFLFLAGMLGFLGFGPIAQAATEDNEYHFKWLDPEKKVYVLQNRKYRKARKLLVSALGGMGFNSPYRTTATLDPRMAFYFTEEWGIEGFFTKYFHTSNNAFDALTQASPNALPVIREHRMEFGGLIHWAPWYAKINVFNTILYFDWYFSAGGGVIQSEVDTRDSLTSPPNFVSQNIYAAYLGTGHQYHLTQRWIVRLDLTGAFYTAPVFGTTGDDVWFSDFRFGAGVGFRL